VKPFGSPKKLAKDSDLRKEIPISFDVTLKDMGAFDVNTLPKMILQRLVKSIAIELQSLYRITPKDKESVEEYTAEYKKLATKVKDVQKHTLGEITEHKAGGKRQRSAEDLKNEEYAQMLGILLSKYEKFVKKDFSILQKMHSAATAEDVHRLGIEFAQECEKEIQNKK
jgi:hypothetical protein